MTRKAKKITLQDRVKHPSRRYGLRVLEIKGERAHCERYYGEPKERAWFPLAELERLVNAPPIRVRLK